MIRLAILLAAAVLAGCQAAGNIDVNAYHCDGEKCRTCGTGQQAQGQVQINIPGLAQFEQLQGLETEQTGGSATPPPAEPLPCDCEGKSVCVCMDDRRCTIKAGI